MLIIRLETVISNLDKARLYFLLQQEHGSGYLLVDLHPVAQRVPDDWH
jgi:hypothetical protein